MQKQTKLWTTKTGEKIRICDMSDTHLINTIRMLDRYVEHLEAQETSLGFSMLSILNGEMAVQSVEDRLLYLEQEGLDASEEIPIYNNLCNEALRRNLDV